jgi:hypothetical protein
MASNRIFRSAASTARKPQFSKTSVAAIPPGFVVCPPQLLMANAWQQEIYRLAYQRAAAEAAIPRHHRSLFCVWN